ncbi:Mucin-associated surface protein (MASP) [Trypanosoma cruzi]|uniref:Mucin-associated surface protein (MASP), putative n=2 Tax=Trypanosoma cruzi TaxID=5693 RepID=Q4DU15_TRYCC|nr:mucin-associated surface protein (MASP), putative [Trypanosoma cruzi]EAN96007.1 mucin-associated surface protein (MASP), putative [Trypanosoma cruzi]PWV19839.1 Mucin-associated surface protein (MASP) [Trypanosoma cruzi]RNC52926.1 mucin-associated surface protein (MASP) [Trypanosoma cruzi]|eukprot:XP_817858.1 mucin-associated surface protein (MASP) [Trypanosoma cruzi strain CL Brener]
MAMMMTGRVLLVCALCVLWCGAGGGGCTEGQLPVVEPPVNPASGAGVIHNPADHTVPGGAGKHSAEQTQLNNVEGSASREVSLEAPLQPVSTTQQTPSSSEPTDSLSHSQSSGGKRQDVQHEGPPGEPETSLNQEENKNVSNGNQQSIDQPSPSGNDDVVSSNSEERTEGTPSSTEIIDAAPLEEWQERENVTPSLEQPRETSTAAPAITTQTSSTTPTDVSESNTVKMSDAAPQSTGTANTNDTTTKIANSDGSTAVSHTTSPLLLLVVACAAAAAVVAA